MTTTKQWISQDGIIFFHGTVNELADRLYSLENAVLEHYRHRSIMDKVVEEIIDTRTRLNSPDAKEQRLKHTLRLFAINVVRGAPADTTELVTCRICGASTTRSNVQLATDPLDIGLKHDKSCCLA